MIGVNSVAYNEVLCTLDIFRPAIDRPATSVAPGRLPSAASA
jgi:hypothetical protein